MQYWNSFSLMFLDWCYEIAICGYFYYR
jgi:hypothetical protein